MQRKLKTTALPVGFFFSRVVLGRGPPTVKFSEGRKHLLRLLWFLNFAVFSFAGIPDQILHGFHHDPRFQCPKKHGVLVDTRLMNPEPQVTLSEATVTVTVHDMHLSLGQPHRGEEQAWSLGTLADVQGGGAVQAPGPGEGERVSTRALESVCSGVQQNDAVQSCVPSLIRFVF